MIYPLAIGGACILTSILGTFFVTLGSDKNIMKAMYKGFVITAISSLVILFPITKHVIGFTTEYVANEKSFNGLSLYFCGIIGLVITGLIIWITEYDGLPTCYWWILYNYIYNWNVVCETWKK
jgi:K(+)-stimulated pyrophosphate-energized sodium pump